jgi:hypothetical protein
MVGSDRIDVVGTSRQLQILYRLPPKLSSLAQRVVSGDVHIVEQSTIGGPDRRVIVNANGLLLMAYVFIASQTPSLLQLGQIRFVQNQVKDALAGPSVATVRVDVFEGSLMLPATSIEVGNVIKSPTGAFRGVVTRSHLSHSAGPGSSPEFPRYVLEAWAVGEKQ